MILSDLPESALEEEARASSFPKWNTLCILRTLGLPTLNAAILRPGAAKRDIAALTEKFASVIRADSLLVRSDGGKEATDYYKGGNTLPTEQALGLANALLHAGRAVILLEPTNRFLNRLSVNFLACRDGTFVVEILGPGYDAADLNRNGVPPQYIVRGEVGTWARHTVLGLSDLRGQPSNVDDAQRRQLRLEVLGKTVLPGSGVEVVGPPAVFAEKWLQDMGYHDLWKPWRFRLDLTQLQRWYDNAFLVGKYLCSFRRWEAFVLPWSILSDGRPVYWDIVDAGIKYPPATNYWAGNGSNT